MPYLRGGLCFAYVAAPDPKDIPDLDLTPLRASSPKAPSLAPAPPASSMNRTTLERETSLSSSLDGDGDEFDMELERSSAMVSIQTATSERRIAPAQSVGRSASGLEVSYDRFNPKRHARARPPPSFGRKFAAWALPLGLSAGVVVGQLKLVHRPGGHAITRLLPHAFDATSTLQSGGGSLAALALAIGLGFVGVKKEPRSYVMVGSASMLLVASIAMVTITLVSTEEQPTPPDGALILPYVVPLALLLLGVSVGGRSPHLFLGGGIRRALALVAVLASGALVAFAIELSPLAAHLP